MSKGSMSKWSQKPLYCCFHKLTWHLMVIWSSARISNLFTASKILKLSFKILLTYFQAKRTSRSWKCKSASMAYKRFASSTKCASSRCSTICYLTLSSFRTKAAWSSSLCRQRSAAKTSSTSRFRSKIKALVLTRSTSRTCLSPTSRRLTSWVNWWTRIATV